VAMGYHRQLHRLQPPPLVYGQNLRRVRQE
jgi:hypothetical protein